MKIKYYGNSCFLFKSQNTKLITNPKDTGVKVNLKKLAPDIVVVSHKDNIGEDNYYLITAPGEYEVKGIFVYGYLSDLKRDENANIYMIDVENVHLGIIDKTVESVREWILNEMGIMDVLFVSLADDTSMKLSKLVDLVNKVEPQVVVPMDYTKERLVEFSKVIGVKGMEKVEKLDIARGDFVDEEVPMRLVVLNR